MHGKMYYAPAPPPPSSAVGSLKKVRDCLSGKSANLRVTERTLCSATIFFFFLCVSNFCSEIKTRINEQYLNRNVFCFPNTRVLIFNSPYLGKLQLHNFLPCATVPSTKFRFQRTPRTEIGKRLREKKNKPAERVIIFFLFSLLCNERELCALSSLPLILFAVGPTPLPFWPSIILRSFHPSPLFRRGRWPRARGNSGSSSRFD